MFTMMPTMVFDPRSPVAEGSQFRALILPLII